VRSNHARLPASVRSGPAATDGLLRQAALFNARFNGTDPLTSQPTITKLVDADDIPMVPC
jgi:hypothetical protein